MSQLQIVNEDSQTILNMVYPQEGQTIDLKGGQTFSVQVRTNVEEPAPGNFNAGQLANKIIQDLKYTAVAEGTPGDSVEIQYVGDGTKGAEVIDVVGTGITVHMDPTPINGSTANEIRTAVMASVPASALVTVIVSGTGSNAQTTQSPTHLENGQYSNITVLTHSVAIAGHPFETGLKGQLTTTGSLPTGLSLATDYYIIKIDENTFQFAASLVDALAGEPVEFSDVGGSGSVDTFTPSTLAGGTVKLQASNDNESWVDYGSTTNITTSTTLLLEKINPPMLYLRVAFEVTGGMLSAICHWVVKGLN